MLTGVTANTSKHLQLNAGVLATGYDADSKTVSAIIGATSGGGSFTAVPTMHQPSIDGMPTHVEGFERIDEWVATLNTTMIELNENSLKTALGCTATKSGNTYTVTNIPKHTSIYWIGDMSDGGRVVIKLSNAMNTNGFNLSFADKGEGTFPLTLVAHYSANYLDTPPFEITIEAGDEQ